MPLDTEAIMSFEYILLVLPAEIAFGETEVMNGVEKIGFTNTIPSADANNTFGKTKLLLEIILELEN
jgi:hypothetical protein